MNKNIPKRISDVLKKLTKEEGDNHQEVVDLLLDIQEQSSFISEGVKYSRLFDYMQNAIAVYKAVDNGNNFKFVNFNVAAEKIEGIKREKVIGKKVTEVFPGVVEFGLLDVLKKVWESGIPQNHPISIYYDDRIIGWRENYVFKLPSGEIVASYRDVTKQKQAEKKVELSEINLKSLIDNRNETIWSIDSAYNYIIFNDYFKELYLKVFKIKLEIGINALGLLSGELYDFWKEKYDRALSGEKFSFEYKTESEGVTYHQEVSLNPIISNKKITGVSAISTDVTERSKNEKALRESEENYKGIFSTTSDAIYIQDKNGVFIDVNVGAEKMYGYNRNSFIGKTPAFISAPGKNNINEILKAVTNAYNGKEQKFEYWGLRKNGEVFPKDVRLYPGKYNGKKVVLAVGQDTSERKKSEKAIHRSEKKFKNLLHFAPDAFFQGNTVGNLIECNEAASILTGYSRKELLSMNISDLFSTKTINTKPLRYDLLESGKVIKAERELVRKNGDLIIIEMNSKKMDDGTLQSFVRDITDRRKSEEALRESEERYRRIVSNLRQAYYEADSSGRITHCNSELILFTGYSESELIGRRSFSIVHKDHWVQVIADHQKCLAEKVQHTITEFKATMKDGSVYWVEQLSNYQYDEDGNFIKVTNVVKDITERKDTEIALRESEEVFRNLSDSTASAIFVYHDEKFVFVNKSSEELTGYSKDELLKMKFWEVVHPDYEKLIRGRAKAREEGKKVPNRYELKIIKKDGSEVWIDLSAGGITWKGKYAAIGSAINITSQKNAENELKENEEMYRLITDSTSDYLFSSQLPISGNSKMDWVGGSFEKITGYTFNEYLKNGGWFATLHKDDVYVDDEAFEELRNNRKTEIEVRIVNKKKEIVWVRCSSTPVWSDKEQRVVSIYGSVKDITKEKKNELAIQESEAKYKLISSLTSDYLFSTTIDENGKSIQTWVAGSFTDITGYAFEEYDKIGGWRRTLHQDDLQKDEEAFKVLENNEKVKVEVRIFHKSGKVVWVETFGSPVWDKKKNKLVGINGAVTDITKEKLASIALKENEEKYRLLSLVTSDYVYETKINEDGKSELIWVGGAFEEITGYTFEEYKKIGEWRGVIHPDDIKIDNDAFGESFKNNTVSMEVRTFHKNGNIIWVKAFGYPLWDYSKNKLTGILGSVKDITKEKQAILAVKESEEKYKLISNITSDYLFESIINEKNILETIWVGGSFKEMTGYTLEEYQEVGGWAKLLYQDDVEIDDAAFKELSNNRKTILEVRTRHKNGRIIWVKNSCSPIWDKENNKLLGVIGAVKNITEEKQNKTIHEIQYNIANAIVNVHNTSELFSNVRKELNKVLNATNFIISFYDEKTEMLIPDIDKDEKDKIESWPMEKSISGVVINTKKRLLIYKEEILELADSGKIDLIGTVPEVWLGVPLKVRGKVIGVMAVQNYDNRMAYDKVSVNLFEVIGNQLSLYLERNRSKEDALRLSRAIVQSPVSVVITNLKGEIEYANPNFEKVSGYTFEEVIGENPKILKSNSMSKEFYQNLWKTILDGKDWRGEFLNKRKNGELFWENAVISPIENDNRKITHFVAIKEDITEKKKMIEELISSKEKAEISEKIKTEFLAQMSHEIRSPLNVILSFVGLLKEDLAEIASEDVMSSFESIDSASSRITRTIDLILNMTDLQLGSYESSMEEISVVKTLQRIQSEYNQSATRKGLELRLNIKFNRKKIISDKYALIQIVSNLVDNAIKYSDIGYIEIFTDNNKNKDLVIKVKDTGIGMSKEYLPNIFKSFSQEEQGYTRSYDGNGLGMALVKKYCDIIKADISVKSTKGKGTTFTLVIPNLKKK